MLKRLRRRIIGTAMAAFCAVILLIVVLVNVINYVSATSRADETIASIRNFEEREQGRRKEEGPHPADFMGLPDREENFMTRYFSVRFNEDRTVSSVSTDFIAAVDQDQAVQYAERVLSKGSKKGYMDDYRYRVSEEGDATIVTFLNASREQEQIRTLLLISILVAIGSLALVFLLVAAFSGYAMRPFVQNIENQKRFITDASHELKTPLTSIAASTEIIELENGKSEWTENIQDQTKRMTKLVGELVALSRLDEAGAVLNKETFSMSEAAWEIAETLQSRAKAEGKTLDIDIQDDLSYYGDKEQLQKMMSVLLDNAVRYSDPQGSIRFVVDQKKRMRIAVQNTCHFDTPPDLDRLFDRFYRPDSSRNMMTGGTGIGLSVAKAVAEKHGGRITASCPDEGLIRFEVLL